MKTYTFKQWHNGYCLYLCTLAAGDYFNKQVALNANGLQLDETHWTWPATAALGLADAGLAVEVHDTDISYEAFVKDPRGWILHKYGQAGIEHIESHFNFDSIIADSKIAVENRKIVFLDKTISFKEILSLADDKESVVILCLNYATVFETTHGRMGHYFLVKGSAGESLVVTEPLRASDVIISKELFEKAEADLDNEVQHFVIRGDIMQQAYNNC